MRLKSPWNLAFAAFCALVSAAPLPGQPTAAAATATGAEVFRFAYTAGSKYRVLSTVEEDIFIDRRLAASASIVNRIAFEVVELRDGSALLRGEFITSVRDAGSDIPVVEEDQTRESEYWCDPLGRYRIDPKYAMPTVRHVPTFPDRPLKPGDTWTAPGEERHDLSREYGLAEPFLIPILVSYEYVGPVEKGGKSLRLIKASYTVFYEPARPAGHAGLYPLRITGYSDQKIYWDPAIGHPDSYEERFRFVFERSDGHSYEYRGQAEARVLQAELMDRAQIAREAEEAVAGLPDVTITTDERGVTITLEDIQFAPDSALLLTSEKAKLDAIAALLARYPGRGILVTGHTALAGSAEGRKRLSEERAAAVAAYLASIGARPSGEILVAGVGADRPIADNATEEGRSRNRRVEITILEN